MPSGDTTEQQSAALRIADLEAEVAALRRTKASSGIWRAHGLILAALGVLCGVLIAMAGGPSNDGGLLSKMPGWYLAAFILLPVFGLHCVWTSVVIWKLRRSMDAMRIVLFHFLVAPLGTLVLLWILQGMLKLF